MHVANIWISEKDLLPDEDEYFNDQSIAENQSMRASQQTMPDFHDYRENEA